MIAPGPEIMMKVWPHPEFSYGKEPTGVITCPVSVSGIGVLGGTVYPWAPGIEYYGNNNVPPTVGHSQSHGGSSSSETPTPPPLARSGWDKKSKVEESEQRIRAAKEPKKDSNGVLEWIVLNWMAETPDKAQISPELRGLIRWMGKPMGKRKKASSQKPRRR